MTEVSNDNLRVFRSRQEWLEARRGYVGGSDAPVVMGVAPEAWGSKLDLWSQKVGIKEIDSTESRFQRWGNRLEPVIREAYVEDTGREVYKDPPHSFRVGFGLMSHAAASLDGIVVCPKRGPGVLQIKTAAGWKRKDWEEEPPLPYQVQVQHEIAVSGFSWGSIAVLMGGNDFFFVDIEPNPEFVAVMMQRERDFWAMVEDNVPPAPCGSEVDSKVLSSLYGVSSVKVLTFDDDLIGWHRSLEAAKEQEAAAQKTKELARQMILHSMGDAELGMMPDGSAYRRSIVHRDEYTVQPTDYVQLRYVKPKKSGK